MTEAEQIMKRCQAGTRNYEEANNLHAACYGMIGKLLAQQEKDYERGFVDGMQKQMQSSVDKAVNRMAQPEQEPVADDFFKMIADRNPKPFPPPQRTWVKLEGEEIRNSWEEATKPDRSTMTMVTSFARAIEAKLKEKNT